MVVVLRFLDQPYLVAGNLRMFAGIGYERRKRRSSIGEGASTQKLTGSRLSCARLRKINVDVRGPRFIGQRR